MTNDELGGTVQLKNIGYAVEYKEVNGVKLYSLHLDQSRADQAVVERHGVRRHAIFIFSEEPPPQAKWPFP